MFGYGGKIEGGKIGEGRWRYGLKLNWRSPQFELNDMGFLRTSDNIHQTAWVKYVILTPFSIFKVMETGITQWSGWDYSGLNKWSGISFEWEAQFKNYFSTEVLIPLQFLMLSIFRSLAKSTLKIFLLLYA